MRRCGLQEEDNVIKDSDKSSENDISIAWQMTNSDNIFCLVQWKWGKGLNTITRDVWGEKKPSHFLPRSEKLHINIKISLFFPLVLPTIKS